MKGLLNFTLLLVSAALSVSAQNELSALVAALPSCGLACMVTAIKNSSCPPSNLTCLCLDAPFEAEATACVTATCSVKDSLTTKNATTSSCHAPIRDKSGPYNILTITMGIISGIIVILRLLSKLVTTSTFGLDDLFVVTTLVVGIPSTVIVIRGLIPNGIGTDVWTIPFDKIYSFAFYFYLIEVIYFALIALLKLSFLFFYLRIFPGTRIRQLIWGTIILNTIYGIVFIFIGIFQCVPISYYWTNWDKEHQGKCVSINALAWSNAAISIALDIWMIALPISQVVTLNLHWKRKVGVALMFGVGTFVTIVSILRLQSITRFANSMNPTWENFDTSHWSTIEIHVGIICVCMPSLRMLFIHWFPKALGTSHPSNTGYQVHNSNTRVSKFHPSSAGAGPGPQNEIMYSQSYSVNRGTSWEHEEGQLELSDIDVVPLKGNRQAH